MNRRISVRAIILHEGRLLAVRHKQSNKLIQSMNNYWAIPGGGLDENESIIDCLVRESIEETGIKPKIGSLMYIQQFKFKDKEYLEFFFNVTNSQDYLKLDLSNTTHGLTEIEEITFIDPKTSKLLPLFLSEENLEEQVNKPTKNFSYL